MVSNIHDLLQFGIIPDVCPLKGMRRPSSVNLFNKVLSKWDRTKIHQGPCYLRGLTSIPHGWYIHYKFCGTTPWWNWYATHQPLMAFIVQNMKRLFTSSSHWLVLCQVWSKSVEIDTEARSRQVKNFERPCDPDLGYSDLGKYMRLMSGVNPVI